MSRVRKIKEGTGWMPRRRWPRKDVATRRNALGSRWQAMIQGCPNGATPLRERSDSWENPWEVSPGTETSQYREEKRGFP
jgi:hypothetical protein